MSEKGNIGLGEIVVSSFFMINCDGFTYSQLCGLAETFGFKQDSVRPTLLRLQRKGVIEVQKTMGRAIYSISTEGLKLEHRGLHALHGQSWRNWDGKWKGFFFLPSMDSKDIKTYGIDLIRDNFIPIKKGFWIRPIRTENEWQKYEKLGSFTLTPDDYERLFEFIDTSSIKNVRKKMVELINEMSAVIPVDSELAYKERLCSGHRVLHLLNKDPDFPEIITGPDWPREKLLETFKNRDKKLKDASLQYVNKLKGEAT